jgi:hypothetical protein
MIVYLSTETTKPGRYISRVHTQAGRLIAQAVDSKSSESEKRAMRQARNWAADREWGTLTIRKREFAP